MKKILSLILTLFCVLSLVGCGRSMDDIIKNESSITGVVEEVYNNSILISIQTDACNSCLLLSARLTRHALTRCQLRARSVLILFIIIVYYIYNIVFKESNKKTRKIQKIRYNN